MSSWLKRSVVAAILAGGFLFAFSSDAEAGHRRCCRRARVCCCPAVGVYGGGIAYAGYSPGYSAGFVSYGGGSTCCY